MTNDTLFAIGLGALGAVVLVARSRPMLLQSADAAPVANDPILASGDDMTHGFASQIRDFAMAIASAEGYGIRGAAPTRANNPGDLKLGDIGHGVTGQEGVTVFASPADGWNRLYRQLQMIADGASHVYDSSMSIAEMANHWTDTQIGPWASNVVAWFNDHGFQGVTVDSPLSDVLYG